MGRINPNRTTQIHAFARTVVSDKLGDLPPVSVHASDAGAPSVEPPSSVPLPKIDDVVGGHYRLIRVLGKGMFGTVYVAQRLDVPEHQVALKILPRSMYVGRNVERELVMLASVGHPNVVQLMDHGTTPDYVWLTMPVYRGETLAERLERGPLTLTEAYDVFLAVARGLEALHEAGLRHQDVKPDNIFLAHFGGLVHPILLDLGVAAERDAAFVAGTALFAAPEQLAVLFGAPGAYPLGEKMDTYCLAATLLFALVGPENMPGESADDRDGLAKGQEERASTPIAPSALPFVTGAPRELIESSFRKWLAFEPSDRPSMTQMATELDVLNEPVREEERDDRRRRARQKANLARFRIAVAALLVLGIAGGALLYSQRKTIELAGQLARAKKEGATSFDKLDTCIASFRVASGEAKECEDARGTEKAAFAASLDNVTKTGSAAEQERARELHDYTQKLHVCEELALSDKKKWDDERVRSIDEHARETTELTSARDKERQAGELVRADLGVAQSERDEARAEVKRISEERDACRAAAAPHATSAPAAGTAAPASGSAAPVAVPAPPPAAPAPAASGAQ